MKGIIRENASVLLLLLVLVAVTSIATYWQLRQETDHPTLATFSTEPDGARALLLWSEALEYEALVETPGVYAPPDTAKLSFILEPEVPGIADSEWQKLEAWVEGGGTLVLAGDGLGAALSMRHFAFDVLYRPDLDTDVVQVTHSILADAPQTLANTRPRAVLRSNRTDHTVLSTVGEEPVVISIPSGQGLVILSTLWYPLSNRGLKESGNPEFVLSVLSLANTSATIWFDEWHHGLRASDAGATTGLGQWLRTARPGQAILYTFAVAFVWLLLSGRRFGRPVPLESRQPRRAPAEHARALANLSRRAGHRDAVREYYRRQLKTEIGYRYGLTAAVPDDAYLERLASARPSLDRERLRTLLQELAQENLSDAQLLKLSQEVNEWIT